MSLSVTQALYPKAEGGQPPVDLVALVYEPFRRHDPASERRQRVHVRLHQLREELGEIAREVGELLAEGSR